MTYTIITTLYRKNGVNTVDAHADLNHLMRDVKIHIFKEYAEKHAERYTGYSIQIASYNAKGKLVRTVTTNKVFKKYVGAVYLERISALGEATRLYSNNLEQLVREVRNAIAGKGNQAYGYIQETEAMREKTGTSVNIVVNNISGVTRH